MKRYRVGILGATGVVGQRLLVRLADHPWFVAAGVAASPRSVGRPYFEAADWSLAGDPPEPVARLPLRPAEPDAFADCDAVFSALPRRVAGDVESAFARAGLAVVSNSAAHRMRPEVPLVVPEINPAALSALRPGAESGCIVTNPNCSVTGLALALAPLHEAFGVERVVVATLQALSGAGGGGPPGLSVVDNVLPWIPGEEDKLESEIGKLLAPAGDAPRVSAHCHRVPTLDGHLEAVSVGLARPASPDEAGRRMAAWRGAAEARELPSTPERPLVVRDEPDRPQPRRDRETGGGMTAVVGRLRPCPVLTLRFVVLSHNAVRGAAGGALLNGELLAARGLLPRRGDAR